MRVAIGRPRDLASGISAGIVSVVKIPVYLNDIQFTRIPVASNIAIVIACAVSLL